MVFNINTVFLGLLGLFIGYNVLNYFMTPKDIYQPPIGVLPVPIEVGKSKIYVSKDRDASMATEIARRRAIIGSNSGPIKKFSYSGSTNGSLETFFLSSVWPTNITKSIFSGDFILDGGSASNVSPLILDGNGSANPGGSSNVFIDAGNAYTTY